MSILFAILIAALLIGAAVLRKKQLLIGLIPIALGFAVWIFMQNPDAERAASSRRYDQAAAWKLGNLMAADLGPDAQGTVIVVQMKNPKVDNRIRKLQKAQLAGLREGLGTSALRIESVYLAYRTTPGPGDEAMDDERVVGWDFAGLRHMLESMNGAAALVFLIDIPASFTVSPPVGSCPWYVALTGVLDDTPESYLQHAQVRAVASPKTQYDTKQWPAANESWQKVFDRRYALVVSADPEPALL